MGVEEALSYNVAVPLLFRAGDAQIVDVTRSAVRMRVMLSTTTAKGESRPSSSANSRTFQGQSVVMEISAAWKADLFESVSKSGGTAFLGARRGQL